MSRKYKILISSLIFYFIIVTGLVVLKDGDNSATIIAIATGITTITGAYYAGNVFEKMKENK